MKKYTFSSLISQFILLIFVIVWIIPTFGLFVTSFRDKDLLSTSGWWTSLITNEVNEIYRTENNESQILENNLYVIKSNLFENINKKKITSFGITSKNINEFLINQEATFKDGSKIRVNETGDYIWKSQIPFENKKGKRVFITALSSPSFTLENYKERVFATADFMASFAHLNENGTYDLGPGVIPAQERFPKMKTFNPTYELAYWNWALTTALEWKERLGETPPEEWKKVAENLSPLPVQEDYYLATQSATDSYTNPEYLTDHPSVLGTYGMLPVTPMLDKEIMNNTFNKF